MRRAAAAAADSRCPSRRHVCRPTTGDKFDQFYLWSSAVKSRIWLLACSSSAVSRQAGLWPPVSAARDPHSDVVKSTESESESNELDETECS